MKKLYLLLALLSACAATVPEKRYNIGLCEDRGGVKYPQHYEAKNMVKCNNGDILLDGSLLFKGKK